MPTLSSLSLEQDTTFSESCENCAWNTVPSCIGELSNSACSADVLLLREQTLHVNNNYASNVTTGSNDATHTVLHKHKQFTTNKARTDFHFQLFLLLVGRWEMFLVATVLIVQCHQHYGLILVCPYSDWGKTDTSQQWSISVEYNVQQVN